MENIEKFKEIVKTQIPKSESIMFDFLITFARFECALKNIPEFLKIRKDRKGREYPEADWDEFSKSISDNFEQNTSKDIRLAVNFILKSPPKKQVVKDGILDWKDSLLDKNASITKKLSIYICRVRNNMFHGGKFNSIPNEGDRNCKLIYHSMKILNYWLELNEEVKENFLSDINPQ